VLTRIKPTLDSLGISLVAIGSGTPAMARNFQEEFAFTGQLFVDQKREVYKALGCNRGLKYVFSMSTLKAAKEASAQGFSQGATAGDALQLGGVFVLSLTKGLLYQHLEEFAGDHPNIDEVLSACKESKN